MKTYDCTIFFDEKMMFDLRLNILNDYVDKFVVVESLYTHSGNLKKQNFNLNDYPKFKNKIIYILLENEPDNLYDINTGVEDKVGRLRLNSLKRIQKQYNALSEGIKDAENNDLILLSDCDEIPNLENVDKKNIKNEIILFKQKIFYYKFNLQYTALDWFGTKACKKKNIKTFNWLRNVKNKKYNFWRIDALFSNNKYINVKMISNGGWHFSKIKNEKDIHYTLSNYGEHNEFEKSGVSENDIKNMIKNKELYFNHSGDKKTKDKYFAKIKLDKASSDSMPRYLVENQSNYKEWFIE